MTIILRPILIKLLNTTIILKIVTGYDTKIVYGMDLRVASSNPAMSQDFTAY
jgi:hypothetical protein